MTMAPSVKKVSLADIAREAGVSVPTVAKVVSGARSNIRVGAETAARIREIAARLQYRPNFSAKALAGVSPKMIGVLIDAQAALLTFRLLGHIEKSAAQAGFRLMVGEAHDSPQNLFDCFEKFQQYNVDGTIVLAHEYPGHEQEIRDFFHGRNRVVFVGESYLPEMPAVVVERRQAVVEAVELLQRNGKRRIGMYHGRGGERYFGFRDFLAALKAHVPDPRFYPVDFSTDPEPVAVWSERVIDEFILPERLDAVFAPNDFYAAALLRHLARRGIRVPEDIAVIGWDDDPFSVFLTPALTTVNESFEAVGQHAFSLLYQEICGKRTTDPPRIEVVARLVRRESA